MKATVSAEWLHQNLSNPDLVILDASLETNASGKAFEKFDQTIPSARKFDLKKVFSDKESSFPNTVPKPSDFEVGSRKLGINQNSEIIVFDINGVYSSPRAWWLFKIMGHEKVSVLDGGLPNWIEKGFPTEKNHVEPSETGDFKVNFDKSMVVDFEAISKNIAENNFLVVDARSEARFNGTGKEPRKGLQSGKIQNSVNIPFQDVLQDGKFKSATELVELFEEKCKGEKELVFSCGSGLTACIIMMANQIGYGDSQRIFDGSWTEWAERNNLKKDL